MNNVNTFKESEEITNLRNRLEQFRANSLFEATNPMKGKDLTSSFTWMNLEDNSECMPIELKNNYNMVTQYTPSNILPSSDDFATIDSIAPTNTPELVANLPAHLIWIIKQHYHAESSSKVSRLTSMISSKFKEEKEQFKADNYKSEYGLSQDAEGAVTNVLLGILDINNLNEPSVPAMMEAHNYFVMMESAVNKDTTSRAIANTNQVSNDKHKVGHPIRVRKVRDAIASYLEAILEAHSEKDFLDNLTYFKRHSEVAVIISEVLSVIGGNTIKDFTDAIGKWGIVEADNRTTKFTPDNDPLYSSSDKGSWLIATDVNFYSDIIGNHFARFLKEPEVEGSTVKNDFVLKCIYTANGSIWKIEVKYDNGDVKDLDKTFKSKEEAQAYDIYQKVNADTPKAVLELEAKIKDVSDTGGGKPSNMPLLNKLKKELQLKLSEIKATGIMRAFNNIGKAQVAWSVAEDNAEVQAELDSK